MGRAAAKKEKVFWRFAPEDSSRRRRNHYSDEGTAGTTHSAPLRLCASASLRLCVPNLSFFPLRAFAPSRAKIFLHGFFI
jgi:hypothetical protein